MTGKTFRVSDHCVLRYLERTEGLDLEPVRRFLDEKIRPGALAGAKRVAVDDCVFEIITNAKGEIVATTMRTAGMQRNKKILPPRGHPSNHRNETEWSDSKGQKARWARIRAQGGHWR